MRVFSALSGCTVAVLVFGIIIRSVANPLGAELDNSQLHPNQTVPQVNQNNTTTISVVRNDSIDFTEAPKVNSSPSKNVGDISGTTASKAAALTSSTTTTTESTASVLIDDPGLVDAESSNDTPDVTSFIDSSSAKPDAPNATAR